MKNLLREVAIALKPKGRGVWGHLQGLKAFEAGDYASALNEWHPLAQQGSARAQVNVGKMYATGAGVPKNEAEAERWYRLAAEQGNAAAQYELGQMYYFGCDNGGEQVVYRDVAEAERWFRLAAKQGNAAAQYELGKMYADGLYNGRETV